MKIRVGFEMLYDFPQPTPMIMVLGTHFSRASDVIVPDLLTTSPAVEISPYRDMFGNWCSRMVAPAGRMRLAADGVVRDSGQPDPVVASASQHAVEDLPADTFTVPADFTKQEMPAGGPMGGAAPPPPSQKSDE